jgi:putative peptidoglycan lipid II flippase
MLGVAVNGGSRLVTAVLIGRLGGPSLLGVTQTAISLSLLLALAWPTSAGSAASRFVAGARGRGDTAGAGAVAAYLLRRNLFVSLCLALVGAASWWALDIGAIGGALVVATLTIAYASYSVARGVQLGAGQVRRSAILDVTSACLGVVGVAVLLLLGARSIWLLVPIALSYMLYSLCSRPPRVADALAGRERRNVATFIWLGVLGTIASAGFLQAAVLVARLWGGQAFAGQYAAALVLATPLSMLAAAVSLSLFPMLAEAAARGDLAGAKDQTTKATASLIAIMLCLVGPVALASGPLVSLVWGDNFDVAGEILPYLVVAVLLNTVSVPSVNALTSGSNRGMAMSAAASFAGLTTGLVTWLLLVPESFRVGVPVGYLLGVVVISVTPVTIVWRSHGHAWLRMWGRFVAGLLLLVSALAWQGVAKPSTIVSVSLAAGFLCLWISICRSDLLQALRSVRR